MKVLKDALKQYKTQLEKLEEDNKKLLGNKEELEVELANQKQQYNEVFEENHHLHDSILELQQKMADEMGMGAGPDPVMDQMQAMPDSNPNDSPYTPNLPLSNEIQETAVKNSKFTFSKAKKTEAQLQ